MWQVRIGALAALIIGITAGWWVFSSEINDTRPFKLGLDLSGGTHLVYRADTSNLAPSDISDSMAALRDTIERRVNLFGVSEPVVQTERGGRLSGEVEERLIIELPGVTNTQEAVDLIGQTPVLEFRLMKEGADISDDSGISTNDIFEEAAVTGAHLSRASVEFGQGGAGLSNQPVVALQFNSEGGKLFADMTRENVGRVFGIFLDGIPISTPVIQEPITGGAAIISGNFGAEEARELVRNLNLGALPVPIDLLSTQTIGATLGAEAVEKGVIAGLWGIGFVALFMLFWYRLPGAVAIFSLAIYIVIMLSLFKLVPVVLTAAGLAGFILSIGLAVDANVLIFERIKEEFEKGNSTDEAVRDGFARAWLPIRDGNLSSIITAIILFWFGTSLVEGFALVFGFGVLISMITAITVSRTFLLVLNLDRRNRFVKFLFGSGVKI
jgi:preprotein translocase subunit SecD